MKQIVKLFMKQIVKLFLLFYLKFFCLNLFRDRVDKISIYLVNPIIRDIDH